MVNLSLELPPGTAGLDAVVRAFTAAGVVSVVAVGNDGPGCGTVGEPGAGSGAFAVAAVDRDGTIDPRSSRRPGDQGTVKPDVAAPGVDVVSSGMGGGYVEVSGSSMAAPVVAGAVALALSAPSPPDVDEVLGQVRDTARPVPSAACSTSGTPNSTYGAGIVDITALLGD